MAKPKAEKTMWSEDEEENVRPSVAFNEDNLSLAVYHGEGLLFNEGVGKVLTIVFTATADVTAESDRYDDKIIIKDISLSDKDNKGIDIADVEVSIFAADGISDTELAPATNQVYTLSGVRVRKNAMTRGLYIINGKKVVVK